MSVGPVFKNRVERRAGAEFSRDAMPSQRRLITALPAAGAEFRARNGVCADRLIVFYQEKFLLRNDYFNGKLRRCLQTNRRQKDRPG